MQEVNLENLIEKIKNEGVAQAEKESDQITEKAKSQAKEIIAQARKEAQVMVDDAKIAADRFKKNCETDLKQASRDAVLTLKQKIVTILDNSFKAGIGQVMTTDLLKELVVKMVDNWSDQKGVNLEVIVNEVDESKLKELISTSFKDSAKANIEIKVGDIDKGLRIGVKDKDVFYDFTDETILDILKQFLNPSLCAVIDKE